MEFEAILLLGMMYFMLYCSVFWLLVYYDKRKVMKIDPIPTRFPLVSILIPVWNAEDTIRAAIDSCIALDYPNKEIIVINDGSTDKTKEICEEYVNSDKITLLNKTNGGKASAMNFGIKHAKGEYVSCLDADSFFRPNALIQMIGYFEDSAVGAVTSSMKVYNPRNWIQMIQWVEYIFAIYLRRLMHFMNCLYVIPGPGSTYRRDVLLELGGFDEHSLTEDMDIAFRIQKAGYRITNSINAEVDTIAPDTLRGLIKQRIRWYAGFCDNSIKYKSFFLNPKYGTLGLFVLPTSFIWVGVLLASSITLIYNVLEILITATKAYLAVGFDLNLVLAKISEMLAVGPTYITWFAVIFLLISILVIYLGLKSAGEMINFKQKYKFYALHLVGYTILISLMWFFALSYLAVRGKSEKTWKGTKI